MIVSTVASQIYSGSFLVSFMTLILGILTTVLSAYDVQCVFVGSCNIWGWVKTIVMAIASIAAIAFGIQASVLQKRFEEQQQQQQQQQQKRGLS